MDSVSSNLIQTIGVVSDTHIHSQGVRLSAKLLSVLQDAEVGLILHAGDICTLTVLKELEDIAPVRAVRGNRDLNLLGCLPLIDHITIGKVKIGLVHSHISFLSYLLDKLLYYRNGYCFERYAGMLHRIFPEADVIVFGHTHIAESRHWQGKLYFNPGSCSCESKWSLCSCGILRVLGNGSVKAEILVL
jgi:putative phosphoesterase